MKCLLIIIFILILSFIFGGAINMKNTKKDNLYNYVWFCNNCSATIHGYDRKICPKCGGTLVDFGGIE